MSARKPKIKQLSPRQLAKDPQTNAEQLKSLVGIDTSIDRLVAQHPNTDEVTLDHLGSSKDKTTRKYVAAHPGTPHDVLFKLASQFPEQFFNNPVLDLILLENPQLLDAIPPRVLSSLVKREYCPVSFLEAAAESKNESVIRALLMNPQTPRSAILKILKQNHHSDGMCT